MPEVARRHDAERINAVAPSESLIPKIPDTLLVTALVIAPVIAMILMGVATESAETSAAKDLWFILQLLCAAAEVIALAVLIRVGIVIKKTLSAASGKIAGSLQWEHGIVVNRPKKLILTDKQKPRLNPYDIPAVDRYGRPVSLIITTDDTGTKVVPSFCHEHTPHLSKAR